MKRKRSSKKQPTKRMKTEAIDPVLQVFANDLIIRRLEKMLSLVDLKNLRLVNRQFNANVITRTNFTSRIFFTVNKDLISSRVLENVSFPIKVIRVQCFRASSSLTRICRKGCIGAFLRTEESHQIFGNKRLQPGEQLPPSKVWLAEEIEHIYDSLEHVEELNLFCPDSEFSGSCFCDAKRLGSSFQFFPSVNRIIQNSKKTLKKLVLRSSWLYHVLEDYDTSLRSCLKHVTHLEIYPGSDSKSKIPESLVAMKNLKCFKIGTDSNLTPHDEEITVQLIRSNVKSLESLGLHYSSSWVSENLWTRVMSSNFSKLTQIEIKFELIHVQSMLGFFQNHKSSLKSLTLELREHGSRFPSEILAILPTLPNLKGFNLNLRYDDRFTLDEEQFAVLKNCNGLQSLQIELKDQILRVDGLRLPEMFDHIPVSMRRLKLIGRESYNGRPLSAPSVGKFSALRSLHLVNCYAAISNETLQAIFAKLTLLKELALTKARKCSSDGFLGNGSPESVSIKNLTNLEKLTLSNCNLTEAIIYKAFEFPKLKFLDISYNMRLTRSLRLRYILTHNPLLEVLCLSTVNRIHRRNEMVELRKFHPSLRLLQMKHFVGMINL